MIEIGFLWFTTSFLVLNSNDIDVIVGMNWLSQYHANINCADRSVTVTHPSGDIIQYWSPSSVYPSEVPLVQADFYAIEAVPPLDIQDVQVVCDFPDVFPEELPGMPPDREVEFVIELVPGTAPISKRPYRMPREELAELKIQLEELENKGFIQPSSSAWGCPVLFVTTMLRESILAKLTECYRAQAAALYSSEHWLLGLLIIVVDPLLLYCSRVYICK